MQQQLIILSLLCWEYPVVWGGDDNYFDVLKAGNVPFPRADPQWFAAQVNAPYFKDIPEVTVCFRFMVESFNEGFAKIFSAQIPNYDTPDGGDGYIAVFLGIDTGFEVAGYHSLYCHTLAPTQLSWPMPDLA